MNHLAQILCAFVFASIFYPSVQASANTFTAKPVRSGDTLISILAKNGFSMRDREVVLRSSAGLRTLFLTLDTQYLVRREKGETELRVFDSQTSAAFKILKNADKVSAVSYRPDYKITLQRIEGRIYGSVLGSVLSKVNSNFVASRFTDAYAFDLKSGKHLKRGARYWFNVQKKYESGHFIKYGEILQTSLEVDGQDLRKRFVRNNDGGVFFNADDLLEKRPLYAPVNYIKIASAFQPNRVHPITGRRQPHLGVDFELPAGEPVLAARKGVVVRYGNNHAAGNYIVLQHSNGMETAYDHLYKIDRKIHQGLRVNAGEKIAEVGCTGYCTRAHLHFAVKKKGRMVDPLFYIKSYPYHMEEQLEARVAQN